MSENRFKEVPNAIDLKRVVSKLIEKGIVQQITVLTCCRCGCCRRFDDRRPAVLCCPDEDGRDVLLPIFFFKYYLTPLHLSSLSLSLSLSLRIPCFSRSVPHSTTCAFVQPTLSSSLISQFEYPPLLRVLFFIR